MKSKNIFNTLIILLLITISFYFLFFKGWVENQVAIDRCLDRGGKWNYEKGICEIEHNYSQAHEHSSMHRTEVLSSKECGCFYCLRVYGPNKIEIWVDQNSDGVGQTAICPYCGIDAVIGDKSGYPITTEFLKRMKELWF